MTHTYMEQRLKAHMRHGIKFDSFDDERRSRWVAGEKDAGKILKDSGMMFMDGGKPTVIAIERSRDTVVGLNERIKELRRLAEAAGYIFENVQSRQEQTFQSPYYIQFILSKPAFKPVQQRRNKPIVYDWTYWEKTMNSLDRLMDYAEWGGKKKEGKQDRREESNNVINATWRKVLENSDLSRMPFNLKDNGNYQTLAHYISQLDPNMEENSYAGVCRQVAIYAGKLMADMAWAQTDPSTWKSIVIKSLALRMSNLILQQTMPR